MEPITIAQSILRKELSGFKITYKFFKIDFSLPENFLLINISEEVGATTEGYTIYINDQSPTNSDIWNSIIELQKERALNILHIYDFKKKKDYLQRLVSDLRTEEDKIGLNEDGIWLHDKAILREFNLSELKEYDLNGISDFFYELKLKLRDEIAVSAELLDKIIENNTDTQNLEKGSNLKGRKKTNKSFVFINPAHHLGRLTFLREKLYQFDFIDNKTSEIQFEKIFTGETIDRPVKWIGNKGALVFFIRELIEREVIKDPGKMKWSITCYCFRDIKDNEFDQMKMRGTKETKSCKYISKILDLL